MGFLKRSIGCLSLTTAILAVCLPHAAAEPAVGVIEGTELLASFDTAKPGTFTEINSVTGLTPAETLVDVDYRWHPNGELSPLPSPQLFGLAFTPGMEYKVRLFTIDTATGVATPVGPAVGVSPPANTYGIDFNPAADRVRVITDLDANVRVSPDTGVVLPDTAVNPFGAKASGVAYDRVDIPIPPTIPANTTAYAIGSNPSSLYTLGGVNQNPSPNGGQLLNPKPLGVTLIANTPIGFDIAPSGAAYATLDVSGAPGLYAINLGSGAATLIGNLPELLSGFAIVPEAAPKAIPTATPDLTPPTVSLTGVKDTMSLKTFLKGIEIRVMASEPASLDAELLAAAKGAKLASFNLILASASLSIAPGQRTLKLKPSRRLIGKPAKAFKVSLRVTATDAANNAATARKTIKVKPTAKKKKKPKR